MIRKLLICPWFGPLPDWMDLWEANVEKILVPEGYDILRPDSLDGFKARVKRVLGVGCPIVEGEGKIHDYRCTFGLLFERELEGYDYWGHTDFDCVYGRVGTFLPDQVLGAVDIFSNHIDYVSGPWSLYRNEPFINKLFQRYPEWRWHLENPDTTGWVEREFTGEVNGAHDEGLLVRRYESWQTRNLDDFSRVRFDDEGRLVEGEREIMVAHFRRTKVYPGGCR